MDEPFTIPSLPQSMRLTCEAVRQIMQVRKRGEKPLAMVHTYGCQQNAADGERMKGMLREMGFSFTDSPDEADLVLFNTCAVREHAEDRVFGNVGALKNQKRRHPGMIIALCGCMMEQEHVAERIKKSFPYVNLVFGTHVIHRFPELLLKTLTDSERVFERGDESPDQQIPEGLPIVRESDSRAFVTVMYGCNNFCSYCIVPYVRGRERSREPDRIVEECRELIAAGAKEITLLGQNVNSYGKDLGLNMDFADLLAAIAQLPGDFLIRFMTSHPRDASHKLFDTMAKYDKIAKHAGAGTLVPITGFSNSIASAALEFKSEGLVLGTAAKMFTIAGPVLVFGISASVVYGLVLVLFGMA